MNTNDRRDPAGVGFGELELDELREDRSVALFSSGYICTITTECLC
ncbi:hypothetical protein [Amycolatopsis magusensis]